MRTRARSPRARALLTVVGFAALHFALSVASLLVGFGMITSAFDGNGSNLSASLAGLVMDVLYFPVMNGLSDFIPELRRVGGLGGYILFGVNSLIWGIAATMLLAWWRARHSIMK